MIESASDNPYWAQHYKPHHIDTEEIKGLCLRAFQLMMSSQGVATLFDHSDDEDPNPPETAGEIGTEDYVYPKLIALHKDRVEPLLSDVLLRLSVLVRTLEDQIADQDDPTAFTAFLKELNAEDGFGTYYEGGEGILTLRECCNKIIHAHDFRPVYDKDGSSSVPGGWAMAGQLELEGRRGKKEWKVAIDLNSFLEGILTFCDEIGEKPEEAEPPDAGGD